MITRHRLTLALQNSLTTEIEGAITSPTSSLMLFGSMARGDASPESDIDVIELNDGPNDSYSVGRVNVSRYNIDTLTRIARQGSLFARHLVAEGKVLRDPGGRLERVLSYYKEPANYATTKGELAVLAGLLDADEQGYIRYWSGFNDISHFLLRTLVYVTLAERHELVFSLREAASRLDRDLEVAVSLKRRRESNYGLFLQVRSLIEELIGTPVHNPDGSLEAYLTNRSGSSPLIVALGLKLLGNNARVSYDALAVLSTP